MATPLDAGLLSQFGVIFPMILVFVIVYGFLSKTEFFKSAGANAAIAMVLAILTIFSDIAVKAINRMAPWMVLFIILAMFLIFIFMIFGIEKDSIKSVVESEAYGAVKMIIIFVVVGVFVGSLFSVISEEKGFQKLTKGSANGTIAPAEVIASTAANDEQTEFYKTLFHPKVLGMIVILLIMVFTILRLASPAEKPW